METNNIKEIDPNFDEALRKAEEDIAQNRIYGLEEVFEKIKENNKK